MSYLAPEKEQILLQELTGISKDMAKKLVSLTQKIRQMNEYNLKETLSTRLIVNASRLIVNGMNPRKACHACIAETLSDEPQITGALKDLIDLSL